MRTMTTTVYTAAELKAGSEGDGSEAYLFGKAFERALERYRKNVYDDPAWASKHRQSLDAVRAAFGSNPPHFDLATRADDVRRSMAWVENNVVGPLRQKWIPLQYFKRRNTSRYGAGYRPGHVKPCPFTGYCMDDAFLEYVTVSAKNGDSPADILRSLPDFADAAWNNELDDQASERAFLEAADANGWEFDESGRMV